MNRRDFLRAIGITSLSLPLISLKALSIPRGGEKNLFECSLSDVREHPHGLYKIGREAFLDGSIDWEKDKVRVALVNGGYSPDLIHHKTLGDIPRKQVIAVSKPLSGKTQIDRTLDAENVWVSSVYGDQIDYLILFKDGGRRSRSNLLACVGEFPPVVPNGGDIQITWDNGFDKICNL